jgi:hypothetical protein
MPSRYSVAKHGNEVILISGINTLYTIAPSGRTTGGRCAPKKVFEFEQVGLEYALIGATAMGIQGVVTAGWDGDWASMFRCFARSVFRHQQRAVCWDARPKVYKR